MLMSKRGQRGRVGLLFPYRRYRMAAIAVLALVAAMPAVAQDTRKSPSETHLFGGIELGSQGLKRMIVRLNSQRQVVGRDIKDLAPDERNIGLVSEIKIRNGESKFTEDAIRLTVDIINKFKSDFAREGIAPDHIIVAVSSGVSAATEVNGKGTALDELRDRIRRETQLTLLPAISKDDEGRYTFEGIVKKDREAAVLIDVGGGSTKIATASVRGGVSYGTRTFATARAKDKAQADDSAQGEIAKVFLKSKIDNQSIARVYVSGGVAYVAATFLAPGTVGKRFNGQLEFSAAELHDFRNLVNDAKSLEQLFDNRVAEIQSARRGDGVITNTEAAKKNLGDAKKIYDLDRLKAGLWLLDEMVQRVVKEEDRAQKKLVFDGASEVAWLQEFVAKNAKLPPSAPNPGPVHDESLEKLSAGVEDIHRTLEKFDVAFQSLNSALKALDSKPHLVALENELNKLRSGVEAGIRNSPTRADLQNLDRTLGEKLERVASAIEKMPVPGTRDSNPAPDMHNGERAQAQYIRGVLAFRRGEWATALDSFHGCVEDDPADARAWFFRAFVELSVCDEPAALNSIKHVSRLIAKGAARHDEICRAAEALQGPIRQRLEEMLSVAECPRRNLHSSE
jgi:tetratricopeptide (TPR) repeat protein